MISNNFKYIYNTLSYLFNTFEIGAILVYDITNRKSFEALDSWLKDVRDICSKNVEVIVVGNKSDRNFERDISFKEAFDYCQKNKLDYIEVSALNGNNVKDVFYRVAKNLAKKSNDSVMNSKNNSRVKLGKSTDSSRIKEENDDSFDYSTKGDEKKKKSSCC
jgi:GTPase SAR1 family protein